MIEDIILVFCCLFGILQSLVIYYLETDFQISLKCGFLESNT